MSRDLQNICSRMKKKTRVEILKLESKEKNASQAEKKKNLSRERENAEQLCCPSMCSLHRDEALIQIVVCWLPNIADFVTQTNLSRKDR